MLTLLALAAALLSALLLYLSSPHSRWRAALSPRLLRAAGALAALLSLLLAQVPLGWGAGSCAMLVAWMLGLVVLPYAALLWPRAVSRAAAAAEND